MVVAVVGVVTVLLLQLSANTPQSRLLPTAGTSSYNLTEERKITNWQ